MHTTSTPLLTIEPAHGAGVWRAVFICGALPRTLARLAGSLTLTGFDILTATVVRFGDVVNDTFTVRRLDGTEPTEAQWQELKRTAVAALADEIDIEAMLDAARRPGARTGASIEPRISFDTTSEITTGVQIAADDRPGLLHDIALALSLAHMRIRSVSVLTVEGTARDHFRFIDEDGRAPKDEAVLAALARTLADAAR